MNFFRRPNQVPSHFKGHEPFEAAWLELDESMKPARNQIHLQELAALLLVDLRLVGPKWPTERFALLSAVLRDLRG